MRKNGKGITLIALVITIIVLLILAGVFIAMLTGDNGILNQTKKAKEETENAEIEERNKLDTYENEILKYASDLPSTEITIPYLPNSEFSKVEGTNLETGLVIKDKKENSYVWIEVPQNIYTTATSNKDYANIENDLKNYTNDYKSTYTDTWYDGCGIANEATYNDLKNTMLSSVYENGGFWISQYEMGTDIVRTENNYTETEVMSKEGMYPYNFVTCAEAQKLASSLNYETRTSSLLFGIQWNLICKHIEIKKTKTKEEIKNDSTSWGNYKNAVFELNKGKYVEGYGLDYKDVIGTYQKTTEVMLTTGATKRNQVLNSYDLAGNVWEFTLENAKQEGTPCVTRGGRWGNLGSDYPVSSYSSNGKNDKGYNIGFRVAIY